MTECWEIPALQCGHRGQCTANAAAGRVFGWPILPSPSTQYPPLVAITPCSFSPSCTCPALAASALVALLLGLNVVRTYQDKLRQFLADVAGEQPSAAVAVGAPAAKFE